MTGSVGAATLARAANRNKGAAKFQEYVDGLKSEAKSGLRPEGWTV